MSKPIEGYLLIADITGYTMYLSRSELEHAHHVLQMLLELLIEHTRPPLIISRLAGDAVVSYGLQDKFLSGQTFVELIEDTYVAIRQLAIEDIAENLLPHTESYEHLGEVQTHVQDMHPVWEAKKDQIQIEIAQDDRLAYAAAIPAEQIGEAAAASLRKA